MIVEFSGYPSSSILLRALIPLGTRPDSGVGSIEVSSENLDSIPASWNVRASELDSLVSHSARWHSKGGLGTHQIASESHSPYDRRVRYHSLNPPKA
jgi:hypothetical protein